MNGNGPRMLCHLVEMPRPSTNTALQMLRKPLARHAKQPTFPSALSKHQVPSFAGATTLDFAGCQIKEMFLAGAQGATDAILPAGASPPTTVGSLTE